MTFVIIGCVAGIIIIEMVGKRIMKAGMKMEHYFSEVEISCEVDGHTYVVIAPNCNLACQSWTAYAADPDCNFSWADAAYMNRLTNELFLTRELMR
jgi:hypothetical protein